MYPDVSGKTLFIHKLAHACIQLCLEKHFIHKLIHAYPGVCVYIYRLTQIDSDNLFALLCRTHHVNLPTADVSADLTLT